MTGRVSSMLWHSPVKRHVLRRLFSSSTDASFWAAQRGVNNNSPMLSRSKLNTTQTEAAGSRSSEKVVSSSWTATNTSRWNSEHNSKGVQISSKSDFPSGENRELRFNTAGATDMDITFLGTASCTPSLTRGVSSIAFRYNGDVWLFDCGESTQRQLHGSTVRPSKIKKIFLSHTHGDHCFGLPGVLCMIGQSTLDERERHGDSEFAPSVIDIYGPIGTRDFVRAALQLTYSRITAPFRVHELLNVPHLHFGKASKNLFYQPTVRTRFEPNFGEREGGTDIPCNEKGVYRLVDDDNMIVEAAPMQHSVPCVGFVVHEKDRMGALRPELVNDIVLRNKDELAKHPLNKGSYFKTFAILKDLGMEGSFTFPDGTVVHGKDINEPSKQGRKVVIMGDTSSGHLIEDIARDADMVVHEATNAFISEGSAFHRRFKSYSHLEKDSKYHGHSTPQMAGEFAAKVNAKQLVLTHFSQRFAGDSSESAMRLMWRIEDMARQTSGLKDPNDVIAAWDFLTLTVHSR